MSMKSRVHPREIERIVLSLLLNCWNSGSLSPCGGICDCSLGYALMFAQLKGGMCGLGEL